MFKRVLTWVAAPVAVIAVASGCTTKDFHAETIVPAAPERVWDVLVDTAAYPEWNPVFIKVDGDYAEGATVMNSVMFPDGNPVDMKAKIKTVTPGRELRQTGGIPGFLTFDHRWLLEPVQGGTKVIQHEVDRGFYLWFWDSSWVEPAYLKVNEALRDRVVADHERSE